MFFPSRYTKNNPFNRRPGDNLPGSGKNLSPTGIKKAAALVVRDLGVSSQYVSAKGWTQLWTVPLWSHLQNSSVWHTCMPAASPMQVSHERCKEEVWLPGICVQSNQFDATKSPPSLPWLWQYVWSASGYSPLFSTNNNFIIECHPFGACWLECRRDCQAAFFCGRRKVYATIQKGHFLNEPNGESDPRWFQSSCDLEQMFGLMGRKKERLQKDKEVFYYMTVLQRRLIHRNKTNLRELGAHFKAWITPRYLRPRTKTGSNVKH